MTDPLRAALESLPHGPSFRFLDRVVSLEPGFSGTASYRVRGNEPFLAGHFPGEPLFPGVLLVEAAAQLAGIIIRSVDRDAPGPRLRLTALKAVKLLGTAVPGETILYEARLLARLGGLVQARASASVNGRIIMHAEITLTEESGCALPSLKGERPEEPAT